MRVAITILIFLTSCNCFKPKTETIVEYQNVYDTLRVVRNVEKVETKVEFKRDTVLLKDTVISEIFKLDTILKFNEIEKKIYVEIPVNKPDSSKIEIETAPDTTYHKYLKQNFNVTHKTEEKEQFPWENLLYIFFAILAIFGIAQLVKAFKN